MKGSPALALLRKEIVTLGMHGAFIISTFGFALLLVVVASFSFRQIGFGVEELRVITPGIMTVVFLFSGMSVLHHGFLSETEHDALSGITLAPVDPALVYLTKCLAQVLFLFLLELFIMLIHSLLSGVPLFQHGVKIPLVGFLFAVGFGSLGTLLSAVSIVNRERDLLLPLLLFPLLIPLIAGSLEILRGVLASGVVDYSGFWFIFVCAYDLITLVLSMVLFEFVVKP